MYPHERSLVQKLEGLPFALVGVNTDSDLEVTRRRVIEEKLTWPSWFQGSTSGPMSQSKATCSRQVRVSQKRTVRSFRAAPSSRPSGVKARAWKWRRRRCSAS